MQITTPANESVVDGEDVLINVLAYDPAVGTGDGINDGDGPAGVDYDIFDSSGTCIGGHHENIETFDMHWNTLSGAYFNGLYTIRVTVRSIAGYAVTKEISVTVNNP